MKQYTKKTNKQVLTCTCMAFQYAHILTGVTLERAGGQYDQRILAFCLRRNEYKLGNNKRHLFPNKERIFFYPERKPSCSYIQADHNTHTQTS